MPHSTHAAFRAGKRRHVMRRAEWGLSCPCNLGALAATRLGGVRRQRCELTLMDECPGSGLATSPVRCGCTGRPRRQCPLCGVSRPLLPGPRGAADAHSTCNFRHRTTACVISSLRAAQSRTDGRQEEDIRGRFRIGACARVCMCAGGRGGGGGGGGSVCAFQSDRSCPINRAIYLYLHTS